MNTLWRGKEENTDQQTFSSKSSIFIIIETLK